MKRDRGRPTPTGPIAEFARELAEQPAAAAAPFTLSAPSNQASDAAQLQLLNLEPLITPTRRRELLAVAGLFEDIDQDTRAELAAAGGVLSGRI